MHVAVLFEYSSLNGGERSMLAVLNYLRHQEGLQFTAIAPGCGNLAEQITALAIPLIPFECRDQHGVRASIPELISQLKAICERVRPDVLHANSLSMARLTGRLVFEYRSESASVKTTRNAEQTSSTAPWRPQHMLYGGHLRDIVRLSRAVVQDLNRNDYLVAVSSAVRDFHHSQELDSGRCMVIRNGVDLQLFAQRDRITQRALLLPWISAESTILLTVGQICLRKGQLDIAQAVLNILGREYDGELHWIVVGDRYSNKPESIAYQRSINRMFTVEGYELHLHQLGFREDIAQLMNAADMLVHGARQEPFGRVLLEAAASGLPIVATDVGGTSEMLAHEHEALLVPPADPAALQCAIIRMLREPGLSVALSIHARHKISEEFTIRQSAESLAGYWKSAVRIC